MTIEGERRNPTNQERADRLFQRGRVELHDPLAGQVWVECHDGDDQSDFLIKTGRPDPSDAGEVIWTGRVQAKSRESAFSGLISDKPGIRRSIFEKTSE